MSDPLREAIGDALTDLDSHAYQDDRPLRVVVVLGDVVRAVLDLCDSIPDMVIFHGTRPGIVGVDQVREVIAEALGVGGDTEPVYPGGGLAFTELQTAAEDRRAALAELANDSQNMGTYDGWPEAGVADFLARDRQQRQVPCSKPAGHDGPHTRHHRTGGEG